MNRLRTYLNRTVAIEPLVVFRMFFGAIMLVGTLRFALNGWINEVYLAPDFHFSYFGFEWVQPLPGWGLYVVFWLMGMAALGIALGAFYRFSAVVFFLSFTYVELLDKTTYLNHYYFISIAAFLLIWLPAHRAWSIDAWRLPNLRAQRIPAWAVHAVWLQLGLVYFFAGVAKLNPAWLIDAQPLALWLPAHGDDPWLGWLFSWEAAPHLFSWGGALFDLTVPFFLLWKRTRVFAWMVVVFFHLITAYLFPIGMFPYVMIGLTLVFFSASFHRSWLTRVFGANRDMGERPVKKQARLIWRPALLGLLAAHFLIQVVMPFRYLAYPGELFWTEEGYRFSWRVMLMEKAGYATFYVRDPETGREGEVHPADYLTPFQEKMMATQPDMILEFAHYIRDRYREQGIDDPEVRVEAWVTLNGERSRLLVDPEVDLAQERESFAHKHWILDRTES